MFSFVKIKCMCIVLSFSWKYFNISILFSYAKRVKSYFYNVDNKSAWKTVISIVYSLISGALMYISLIAKHPCTCTAKIDIWFHFPFETTFMEQRYKQILKVNICKCCSLYDYAHYSCAFLTPTLVLRRFALLLTVILK